MEKPDIPIELYGLGLVYVSAVIAGLMRAWLWYSKKRKNAGVASSNVGNSALSNTQENHSVDNSKMIDATGDVLPVIAIEQWLDRVNNHPDKVPHLAATGASGSGKTTLITAVLATRQGKVLVCTPKPDDDWGGVPFVTIDDDLSFTSIKVAAQAIDKEIKQRWLHVKNAKRSGTRYNPEWLTVVIDDYPFLRKQINGLADTVLNIARMGRSMRVRLVLLAQESSVKAWGIEGEGEARENFIFMDLEEEHWKYGGAMMYRWARPKEAIDTRGVAQLALRRIGKERWFDVPRVSTFSGVPVRDDVLNTGGTLRTGTTNNSAAIDEMYGVDMLDTGGTVEAAGSEAEMIQYLLQRYSKNRVAALLGGSKSTAYRRIEQAVGALENA